MPTYQEYQEQISKLQVLAEQARQDEILEARKRIQELMKHSGLTIADLQNVQQQSPAKKRSSVAAKYRDPSSGQTWTGRGRAPRWLDAKRKDEFLIQKAGETAA